MKISIKKSGVEGRDDQLIGLKALQYKASDKKKQYFTNFEKIKKIPGGSTNLQELTKNHELIF